MCRNRFGVHWIGMALFATLTCSSCGQGPSTPAAANGFHEEIQQADAVILYEGLPHQHYDQELLQKEKDRKKTVELLGYPFYEETLMFEEGDAKRLTEIFSNPAVFRKWAGEKKCGGFHPDYAIEWRIGSKRYLVLVCFGCGELKFSGPEGESRHDTGEGPFGELLGKYRKNRPEGGRKGG